MKSEVESDVELNALKSKKLEMSMQLDPSKPLQLMFHEERIPVSNNVLAIQEAKVKINIRLILFPRACVSVCFSSESLRDTGLMYPKLGSAHFANTATAALRLMNDVSYIVFTSLKSSGRITV